MSSGPPFFDVETPNNILAVWEHGCKNKGKAENVLMAVLAQNEMKAIAYVQKGSHMHLHKRLEHLHYNNIMKMAANPASGIHLTDKVRDKCLACVKRKQTKKRQSSKDFGANRKFMSSKDHLLRPQGTNNSSLQASKQVHGDFFYHRTNCCQINLAKTKDVVA